ncbi:nicotinic acid mononucleotide adenylyltransferase [Levilactobacillus paucivorans]|uniref:Probable nicotinate-nucleotide adenylyltransferase n=1 Tax=Levilactobacillus paucivorans TaxID=616990 RepID=A0A0R2LYU2_9LACO|nr:MULTISPECIES: nicotinate-nucleotide adenylyltransferase [Levilactobacillus]KRO04381.1 nicotinic acid mononucleotide adenylyltransferase [Levilactobacillus paucivorans]
MVKIAEQTSTQVATQMAATAKKRRIGILGGTFNPPHLGHLVIADQVATQLGLDKVLFMPDAEPPHVDRKIAIPAADRVAMVKAAIKDNPRFALELTEVERGGKSYSYDTMLQLTRAHPENQYYFIIGGDMVAYLPKWYRINDLLKLVQFVGVCRQGFTHESPYPVLWVDVPQIGISSTMVRDQVRRGQSVRYLVPTMVDLYIKEHLLYRD